MYNLLPIFNVMAFNLVIIHKELWFLFLVGGLVKSTTKWCSHLFFVQFSWQCNSSSIITWPTRLILSMYSEIGYGPANNCLHCTLLVNFGMMERIGFMFFTVLRRDSRTSPLEAGFFSIQIANQFKCWCVIEQSHFVHNPTENGFAVFSGQIALIGCHSLAKSIGLTVGHSAWKF